MWERFFRLLREQLWAILIVAVLAVNGYFIYGKFLGPPPTSPSGVNGSSTSPTITPPTGSAQAASPLDGAAVPPSEVLARPIGVMIDNFASARPASGLSEAREVWETLVEGGVTRFLAVFSTNSSTTIGPVRSARDYVLPWAAEVGAIYAHSGGSVAALADLKAGVSRVNDADEFTHGRAYARRAAAAAPHNLYTTTAKLRALASDEGWVTTANVTPWLSGPSAPEGAAPASNITINFSSDSAYRVQWRYDQQQDRYLRSQGGLVATDRATNAQLSAVNVIIEFATVAPAPSPAPPEAVTVSSVGRGEAWFLRNGKIVKGQWRKSAATDRTSFLGPDGQPYAIAPGPVWVEVVPKGKKGAVTVG